MNLPDRLNRKAIKLAFTKVSDATWEYLFDHEKENGLVKCRTKGWSERLIFYSTPKLKEWLVGRCYYLPGDFETRRQQPASPWAGVLHRTA